MNSHADKTSENKSHAIADCSPNRQSNGVSAFQFVDNRPETIAQRKLKEMANNTSQAKQMKVIQEMANNIPKTKQNAPVQMVKTKSMRIRVREKLEKDGYATLTPREKRFVPQPPPGLVRPTANELQQEKQNLNRADYGIVNPNLQSIRTKRDADQSPELFTDHLQDVRRSTTELMSQPVGNRMLTELNARQTHVNPPAIGNNPSTMVNIHSGRGLNNDTAMSQSPKFDGTIADVQRGYRFDGVAGTGQASKVTYDESKPSANRDISLGHEMVHAWRTAHGLAVAPPQISHQRNAAVLNRPDDPDRIFEQSIALHAQHKEEFETVGLQPTPHTPMDWAPSENLIREEHGKSSRDNYSGAIPGGFEHVIDNLDEATDNRNWFEKNVMRNPHPHGVKNLLHHLED